MIDYYREVEKKLEHRRLLGKAVINLKRQLNTLVKRSGPIDVSAVDLERPFVSSSYSADSLAICLEILLIKKRIRETQEDIDHIDAVIDQLDKKDAELLRMWYIKKLPKSEIAKKLSYAERKSVYEKIHKIVKVCIALFYGNAASAAAQDIEGD